MKLPRSTVLRLMIAVAIVSVIAGISKELNRRSVRFKEMALDHRDEIPFRCGMIELDQLNPRVREILRQESIRTDFHSRMAEKYERAARYPWLPVAPDPPEPE